MWNLENLSLGAENILFFCLYLIIYMAAIDDFMQHAKVMEKTLTLLELAYGAAYEYFPYIGWGLSLRGKNHVIRDTAH